MIALLLAQIRTRWGQALSLLVLSMVATGAAVSAPVFADSIDRAAAAEQAATASSRELMVSIPVTFHEWSESPSGHLAHAEAMSALGSFEPVFTAEIRVRGLPDDPRAHGLHRLLGRDGFCQQVVFSAGRCPVASREIALPRDLATSTSRSVGDQVTLVPAVEMRGEIHDDGPPAVVTVVGIFDARDPDDPYWTAALHPLGAGAQPAAIFTNRTTVQTMAHVQERFHADAILRAEALTPEQIPRIRGQIADAARRLAGTELPPNLVTEVPSLLDRIEDQGGRARLLLPVAVSPLAGLCWLVLFLAVGHGVAARRQEIGAIAVRGVPARTRAAVVASECLAPVLLGVPLGLGLAIGLGGWVGPAPGRFALPAGQLLTPGYLLAAGVALAGSLVAVLLALRRELATPVAKLLRRVAPRGRAAVAGEVLLIGAAGAVIADLRFFDRDLVGLLTLAPALVMVAAAVLAARVARVLTDLAGRWSLRHGRLAPALAARHLVRRTGATRLLVVLGVGFGLLCFGTASAEVAAAGRAAEAERTLGAARVVSVAPVDAGTLLAAVRAADPAGVHAMAAIRVPRSQHDPPRLAVDASRLAPIARWPEGGPPVAEVAAGLRPEAPAPAVVHDGVLVAELVPERGAAGGVLTVEVRLVPVTGGQPVTASFGRLVGDQATYRAEVSGCPEGCRMAGLTLRAELDEARDLGVVLRALRQGGEDVTGGDLADPARWRSPDGGVTAFPTDLQSRSGGLSVTVERVTGAAEIPIGYVDAPYPLPVVTAGDPVVAGTLRGIDHELLEATTTAVVPALPLLGASGVLMDLEYAERSSARPGTVHPGQVWLAADAPAGIVDRLRAQGLHVTGDQSVEDLVAAAERTGAAHALRFFQLAGAAAGVVGLLALALVVTVDRRGGGPGGRELRRQGVRSRTLTWAAVWSYGGVVLTAALTGAFGAAAAWLATGDRLPFGLDRSVLPPWPDLGAVAAPWTVAAAVLLVAALAGAVGQRAGARTEGAG